MINSCIKGKRGERMWRDKLREHGFLQARRGQQFSGSDESPDVVCPELPSIHFEVKNCERFGSGDMHDAMAQSKRDAGDYKIPVVTYHKNNYDWLVIMNANDWLNLVKETEHVKSVFCPNPGCGSSKVWKNGFTEKSKQKYKCCECGHDGWSV